MPAGWNRFFQELKRRNVYRVATVYAITGWIIVEVTDTVFPHLGLPEWLVTALVVVILAGFPLALILSWIYDIGPEGFIKTDKEESSQNSPSTSGKKPFTSNLLIVILAILLVGQFIYFGIIALVGLSAYLLFRTHTLHKKKSEKERETKSEIITASYQVLKSCDDEVEKSIEEASRILINTYTHFFKEKHKELKVLRKESKKLTRHAKQIREEIPITLKKFEESDLESGHHYVQVVTYMIEMCNSLTHIVQPAFNHLDNNHSFDKEQSGNLKELNDNLKSFFEYLIDLLKHRKYDQLGELVQHRDKSINLINDILYHRVKIIKKKQKGVKVSVTYIEMLSETKNLLLNVVQLVKSDFKLLDYLPSDAQ